MTLIAIILVVLFGAGCYTSIRENTEFPTRLKACRSISECQVLEMQARRDVGECTEKITIYMLAEGPKRISCNDARENLQKAEDKVARLNAARLEEQRVQQERRDEERAEQERQTALENEQERKRLEQQQRQASLDRFVSLVAACESAKDARAALKKHAEIMQNDPAAFVQKRCTPKREAIPVQGQCTDTNGFVRTCTKQVAGDLIGYTCPKSVDPDVVKLGLYRLNLIDDPFPEDRQIGLLDTQCSAVELNKLQKGGTSVP